MIGQFKNYLAERQQTELLNEMIGLVQENAIVMESMVDYMGRVVAKIKNTDGVPSGVDLAQLALYVTVLKILGKSEYRQAMTKDDVGINPNDAKEVANLLTNVKADGQQDQAVQKVMTAIAKTAKNEFKQTYEMVKGLEGDDAKRQQAVQNISKAFMGLQKFMGDLKSGKTAAAE